MQHNNKAHCF